MKAPKFYKSGLPSHINTDPTKEQNTAELLKWISDVTIKRRQIRRSTHCSNLFAEAILSSALRKAKKDLAHKQEEKRKKLRLFCLNRSKKDDSYVESDFELVKTNTRQIISQGPIISTNSSSDLSKHKIDIKNSNSYQVSYVLKDLSSSNNRIINDGRDSKMMTDSEADDEVKACLSSLESFFKELKSVKVKV